MNMVVAEDVMPIWLQAIFNSHDDICWLVLLSINIFKCNIPEIYKPNNNVTENYFCFCQSRDGKMIKAIP